MGAAASAEPFASFSARIMVEQSFGLSTPQCPPPHPSSNPATYFFYSFQETSDEKNKKNKVAGWVLLFVVLGLVGR
jgi:hypothetical protein